MLKQRTVSQLVQYEDLGILRGQVWRQGRAFENRQSRANPACNLSFACCELLRGEGRYPRQLVTRRMTSSAA